jgi:hypothetical protein
MAKTMTRLLLPMLLVVSGVGYAQESGPETVAKQYFAVLQRDGLTAVGRFMHPEALEKFRSMMLPVYEAEAGAGRNELRSVTFGSQSTIADVRALDPVQFVNGFMNLVAAQTGGSRISFDTLEIVGVVAEGDQRHVLARITVGVEELRITEFEVLSFAPYEGGWRLQLNGEMQGLAAALRARMEGR